MLEAATAGCELEDCAEKAVVLFYVDAALANVTNAYLAFSTVSDTVLYSEEDFQERAAVFAETLQEVANLNANLTDYFVSCLVHCLACLACLSGMGLLRKGATTQHTLTSNAMPTFTAAQLTINEFADKSAEERNGLNGVRGMRKSPPPPSPPEASTCVCWLAGMLDCWVLGCFVSWNCPQCRLRKQ